MSFTGCSVKTIRLEKLLAGPTLDIEELKHVLFSGVSREASNGTRALAWRIMLGCLPVQKERRKSVSRRRRLEYMELVKEYFNEDISVEIEDIYTFPTPHDSSDGSNNITINNCHYVRGAADIMDQPPNTATDGPSCTNYDIMIANNSNTKPSSLNLSTVHIVKPRCNDIGDSDDTHGGAGGEYTPPTMCASEEKLLRQIRLDVPRTSSAGYPIFASQRVQKLMERVLFCWSLRHPASGYVQGINDLLVPFIVVFMRQFYGDFQNTDAAQIPSSILMEVESDSYWCLSKILGFIQDHYTYGQPGIQKLIIKLKEIVRRIDEPLFTHLERQGVDFLQFAFRWMNCLLARELPITAVIRLWDSYIAEGTEGFSVFHLYVCAAFLVYWSKDIRQMDFQQIILFLQKLPTNSWSDDDIATLIAEAYILKSLFYSSPRHLEFVESSQQQSSR